MFKKKLYRKAAACGANAPLVLSLDVSDESQATTAVQRTVDELGKLDILVNNAGILIEASLVEGNLLQVYDEVMNTNLRAVFHLTSLAVPHLIKTKGNVINISSIAGIKTVQAPTFVAYGISKAVLIHFTKAAAAELAPHGVRVNVISPGPVVTDILQAEGASISWDTFKQLTAMNRVAHTEEIADLILFLADDKARSITGSNCVSDNGLLLK